MCPYKYGTTGARGREGRANYARRIWAIQASRAPFELIPMNEKFRSGFELEAIGPFGGGILGEAGRESRDPQMIMPVYLLFTCGLCAAVKWE